MSANVYEAEPMKVDDEEVLFVLSLKWTNLKEPQKVKRLETRLHRMLQTWFNKCKHMVDCAVERTLKDGRVVVKAKPAPALADLQKLNNQTLTGRDGQSVTIISISLTLPSPELDTQVPEDASINLSASLQELQTMQHSALSDNQQHSSPTDTTAAVQHSSLSVNQQHLTPIDTPGAVQPSAMGKNEQHLKPTDTPAAVEDGALIVLSLKWTKSDDEPQKTKKPETSLHKMLQSWFNKCIPNVDCSVKRILKDGSAVINIKPAPAITELQKLSKETLTEKETEKGAGKGKKTTVTITSISLTLPSPELDTQLLTEDDSSEQDQQGEQSETGSTAGDQMGASFMPKTKNEHIQPGKESNTGSTTEEDSGTSPMYLQTEQVQVGKQSSRDPAGEEMYTCSVPVGHFWYVSHMYEEEMKLIEKENGVKIMADVKVRFEEDQKHGRPDRALKEFVNLVQKSLVESSGSVIPLKFIDSYQWGDALKTIQKKKNKLLVTLTSETMTVCGPGQSQDVISKCLYADTHWKRNTDASHQEYERETQESLKIDVTTKDDFPHAGLIIEETFWKSMTNSYNKEIEKIKAKFNVAFNDSDIDQGKVNVTALYKKEGNASMESHALRALLCLHQRFVSSQFHGATGISGTIMQIKSRKET
ncbi:uncharacterized protein LOC113022589 isoform X2 [Astatotilapia calliptera]|uniref:uncharacterized protein LOC113022589 isoform X2 n=1 Tax=Astatotilapia calliptera TaxID=8154 RepID=UPI000E414970|nr:uncharacterized protein LOC113022589 isoform X2 [Astatotilapia calliptera]